MEQRHKDLIQQNFGKILKATHIDVLLPRLEAKGIFPEVLMEQYKLESLTPTKKKETIFLHIQKRGPDAFKKLLEACLETGHYELYKLLNEDDEFSCSSDGINCTKQNQSEEIDRNRQNDITRGSKPFDHPDFNKNKHLEDLENTLNANNVDTLNIMSESKLINVKLATKFMDDPYNKVLTPYTMRGPKRGALFMINNITFKDNKHDRRNGAEIDEINLKRLFTQLNFEIFSYSNQTKVDMDMKIDEFTKSDILDQVDSVFVIIMSHGDEGYSPEDTRIITYDDKTVPTFDVINKFNNNQCPRLQNKPKVLLFQMCRGDLVDYGTKFYTQSDGRYMKSLRIQVATDMLICYTAYPGFKSFRDPNTGSWFIESLCDVFMEHACDTHVQDMLQLVADQVKKKQSGKGEMQVISIQNYHFRPCYLNPGLQRKET